MDSLSHKRPELGAGDYSRDDTAIAFYLRLNALIGPNSTVLDLGAGRGAQLAGDLAFPHSLKRLQGRVAHLAGCDIDPVVLTNPYLDEARLISADGILPFENQSFDLIYSDWVIEHVEDVQTFISEIDRILKPGGWFCARTPNKWGYIALAALMVPRSLEQRVLAKAQPGRADFDVFPKHYRLNTLGALKRAFPADRWINCSYATRAYPAYHGGNALAFHLIDIFQSLTPSAMGTVIMVFMQKRR